MDIHGKVAIVTGGADGIGRAIVEQLLIKGAKAVTILDVNVETGEKTLEELRQEYGEDRLVFVKCDVSEATLLEAAFASTKSRFGGLDIVCNNAGIGNEFKLDLCVAVNLVKRAWVRVNGAPGKDSILVIFTQTAVIRGTYLAVEHMGTKNGGNGGVVINTASTSGFYAIPLSPIYVATKHGVVGFTRSVAKEPMVVDNGVRVSAICPGVTKTSIIDLKDVDEKSRYGNILRKVFKNPQGMTPTDVAISVITMIEDTKYDGSTCMVTHKTPLEIVDQPNIVMT
uniref:15-hydroxyprostaglandin dehydrogenase [NAD(+)] n=1 Tax=Saccoglossus kowalevskii TaxID=10224 RepID=A0ABM0MPL5_SACKO|nr:PREDICTED: 15-hydroxyprostaglandin dehydrogenase [NAD(+)]-like [Saccoglossus kowalevskii]